MAKKQNKQWNGMASVGRVALTVIALYILLVLFYDPDASPLYIGGGHSNSH